MTEVLDELVDGLKAGAENNAESFDAPDDDWLATAMIRDSARDQVYVLGLIFEGQQEKEAMVEGIRRFIREKRADACAVILSAWIATLSKEQADEIERRGGDYPRASKSPLREERLVIIGRERGGVNRCEFARILRNEDAPPTLGEWEGFEDAGQGLFADLLEAVE